MTFLFLFFFFLILLLYRNVSSPIVAYINRLWAPATGWMLRKPKAATTEYLFFSSSDWLIFWLTLWSQYNYYDFSPGKQLRKETFSLLQLKKDFLLLLSGLLQLRGCDRSKALLDWNLYDRDLKIQSNYCRGVIFSNCHKKRLELQEEPVPWQRW